VLHGTHVKALVGEDAGDAHRLCTGDNTWNNLVVVSFDTMITYLNVGWEGSAHDMTVLWDSILQPKYNFPHSPPITCHCKCDCKIIEIIISYIDATRNHLVSTFTQILFG